MPTDVVMPQMGESIFEGAITKWLKQAGDRVEKDEPLFEISTDKVDAEIPAPVAGVLTEIRVPVGATVDVNTVVAVISDAALAERSAPDEMQTAGAKAQDSFSGAIGTTEVVPCYKAEINEAVACGQASQPGRKLRSSPLVRRIAKENSLDLNLIHGSGSEGRITKEDVLRYLSENGPGTSAPQAQLAPPQVPQVLAGRKIRSSPLVRRIALENNLDLARIAGSGSDGRITKEDILSHLSAHGPGSAVAAEATLAAPQAPAARIAPKTPAAPSSLPGQVVTMTKMRAIIAQRMVESKQTSPHVHTVYKVDMTRIVRLRERNKARFEQAHGVKLTFMPFIAAAAVHALTRFPVVNASLAENAIHYHEHINLGIAVALDWGLIVPVVKQAEERSFLGLARAIADLAARARTKKLTPDEVQDSTFTLTNSGIFGDELSTPIINQPNSAILGVSGLKKEPVVLTDDEGNDTIGIRSMQHFCLGFDHRIIDGADGCKFMSEFKKTLENWDAEIG